MAYGQYRKINPTTLFKTCERYRILSSSLSTLLALRDKTENEETQMIYTLSINRIKSELNHLTNETSFHIHK